MFNYWELLPVQSELLCPCRGYIIHIPCICSSPWEFIPPLVTSHIPSKFSFSRSYSQWLSIVRHIVYYRLWLGAMRVSSTAMNSVWIYMVVLWLAGTQVNAIKLDITDQGKISLNSLHKNQCQDKPNSSYQQTASNTSLANSPGTSSVSTPATTQETYPGTSQIHTTGGKQELSLGH